MGTTADKLNKILETKNNIKQAIINKGVAVSDTDSFSLYPEKINQISTSSSSTEEPSIVYRTINNSLYRQVYFEDFNNDELDKNIFVDKYLPSWTASLYTANARYEISNSCLTLKIIEDQEPWCPESDGVLRVTGIMTGVTNALHKFSSTCTVKTNYEKQFGLIAKEGYFEIRCRSRIYSGMHSAWWFIGIQDKTYDDRRTQTGEIDVFELMGNNDRKIWRCNILNQEASRLDSLSNLNETIGLDMGADFHTFGMEWTTDDSGLSTLKFYCDDTLTRTMTTVNLDYPLMQVFSIYERPVGTETWSGELDTTSPYPRCFDIDYIKLYKKATSEVTKLSISSIDLPTIDLTSKTYKLDTFNKLTALPSYVTINYNDGSRTENFVNWERFNSKMGDYIKSGVNFDINGNINIDKNLLGNNQIKATIMCNDGTTVAAQSIALNKTSSTIEVGKTEQLTVEFTPSNTTNQLVTWSTNDPTKATVSNGLVTGIAEGEVIITATSEDGGFTASCNYSVIALSGDVPTTSLLVWADMSSDQNTETKLADLSGNGNTFTLKNFDSTETSGYTSDGLGLAFDGKNDNCQIDKAIDFNRNNCSFMCTILPESTTAENTIWSTRTTKEDSLGLRFNANTTSKITLIQSLIAVSGYTFSNAYTPTNEKYYICVTNDNGIFKLYLDGKLVETATKNVTLTNTVTDKFSLGAFNNNGTLSSYFKGKMYSFRLYNRTLTDLEVEQCYVYDKELYETTSK